MSVTEIRAFNQAFLVLVSNFSLDSALITADF